MNVSFIKTALLALLLVPLWGWAQSVEPYRPERVAQTDTFSFTFVSHNLATIVKMPDHSDYYEIINLAGGLKKIVYSPDNAFVGRDSILIEYYPKLNSSQEYMGFVFLVSPSIVTANNDFAITDQNTAITVDVLDNDESTAGGLVISSVNVNRYGSATINNGQIDFDPEPGFTGLAQISYTCCDSEGICATGIVNIHVLPPSLTVTDTIQILLPINSPKDIMLQMDGYDVVSEAPGHGDVQNLTTDVVTYTPDLNYTGNDQFTVTRDDNGTTYSRTVDITVFNTLAPKRHAINDYVFTHRGEAVSFNVLDNDIGAFTVLYPQYISVNVGTLVYNGNGQFTYTPPSNYEGKVTFNYSLGSAAYGIIIETGKVEINISDFKPKLPTYYLQTLENKPLVIRYSPPVEPWTFSVTASALHGEVEVHSGMQTLNLEAQNITGYNLVVYTPDQGFSGDIDEFELNYCANGVCKEVKFQINVLPNPAPNELQCLDDCVWAGDANNDGIVNVRDLLPMGLSMGKLGVERDNPSSDWEPQFGDDWNDPWDPSSIDLKFMDTNGDGLISALDTTAISESYLNTHAVTTSIEHQLNVDADLRFVVRDTATYADSVHLILDMYLGLSSKPAYDAYGFSFEIDFADFLEVSNLNIRTEYYDDSWMARQVPTLELFKRLNGSIIQCAYTKTDGVGSTGYGPVGFVIVEDVEGLRPDRDLRALIQGGQIKIRQITQSTASGQFNQYPDQVINVRLGQEETILPNRATELLVSPNPASSQAWLTLTNGELIEEVTLYTTSGSMVYQQNGLSSNQIDLPVHRLDNGLYIAQVRSSKRILSTKVEVIR
ncbi:MAG: cadherin-like domain-containing protein [Lewinellaceae bacterium]|nr:cadherin-like domain-containing protein [Saprospiraceae bacterium]MCB9311470.1 cadherin-like domain-containing protein [Lewinellaceae bacterium]